MAGTVRPLSADCPALLCVGVQQVCREVWFSIFCLRTVRSSNRTVRCCCFCRFPAAFQFGRFLGFLPADGPHSPTGQSGVVSLVEQTVRSCSLSVQTVRVRDRGQSALVTRTVRRCEVQRVQSCCCQPLLTCGQSGCPGPDSLASQVRAVCTVLFSSCAILL